MALLLAALLHHMHVHAHAHAHQWYFFSLRSSYRPAHLLEWYVAYRAQMAAIDEKVMLACMHMCL